jgi:cation diffusion facilitator family transporter
MADPPTSATRNRRTSRAAALSVLSNSVLVVAKLFVGLAIGSVAVVSEAIHSAVDLLAALIAWFAVTTAGKPADDDHPYGHGKIENLSAVIEALLIVGASAWIIVEAVHKFSNPTPVTGAGWGFAVMAASAGINLLVSTYLMRVGKECDSIALQADAWHLRTDVFTSAGVMLALGVIWAGATFAGADLWWVDPAVAIVVALLILKAAFELTWQAGGDLLDQGLPPAEVEWIRGFVHSFLPRITGFHDLRTRKAGAHRFIDVHVVVEHQQTVGQAHEVAEAIEQGVRMKFPASTITVHLDPCDASCPPRCLSGCLLERSVRHAKRAERGLPPIDPPTPG